MYGRRGDQAGKQTDIDCDINARRTANGQIHFRQHFTRYKTPCLIRAASINISTAAAASSHLPSIQRLASKPPSMGTACVASGPLPPPRMRLSPSTSSIVGAPPPRPRLVLSLKRNLLDAITIIHQWYLVAVT